MRKAKKYLNDNNIRYDTLNKKVQSTIEKILGYTDDDDNNTMNIIDKINMVGGRVVLPKEYFNGGRVVLPKEYFNGGRVVLPKEYFNGGRGGNIYNAKKYILKLKNYISMRGGKLSLSKELERQINENMKLLLLNSIVDKDNDTKTITMKSLNDSAKLLKSIYNI